MNTTSQLDIHPDAESLNAFAEKALPERERGQIVAHLAVCSRCRQVIFLARQAAAEMEVAAVPAVHAARRSGLWLSGWRVAWIPAAALATVVWLAFLVHGRHEQQGTEVARAVPQVAPQEAGSVTKPAATAPVIARKSSAPVLPEAPKPGKGEVEAAPAVVTSEPIPTAPAAANEQVTVAAAQPSIEPPLITQQGAEAGQVMNMAKIEPVPPSAYMPQRITGGYSRNSTATYAPKANMDEMEERYRASGKAQARYADSGAAPTSQIKKNVMPHNSYETGARMPAIQFEAAREAEPAPLPSGLTAVSTVTARYCTLEIDQAGALFLSKDSGGHWESVAQQWTGRAVDVSLLQSLNDSSAAAPPVPAEVFELRNDKNQSWVSRDGMIWKAK